MVQDAKRLIKQGFTDLPAVHLWAAEQRGDNMKRFAMIFQKLLELNKEVDKDLIWRPTRGGDSVIGSGGNTVGSQYRNLVEKYKDSPYFASPDNDDKLNEIAQKYIDSKLVDIPKDDYEILIQRGINVKRLSILMKILLEIKEAAEKEDARKARALSHRMALSGGLLMPRRSVRLSGAVPSSDGTGPSSFGARLPTRRNVLRSDQKEREEAISRLDSGRGPYNVEAKLISIGAVAPHLSGVKIEELRKYYQRINFLMSEIQSRRDQEEDIKYSPFARDGVLIDPGLEFRRSKYAINDMLGPSAAMQRRLNPVAAADEGPSDSRQRRRTSARLRALSRRMGLRGGLLMPRRSLRLSDAGPSSFGANRYKIINGRKRRLYKGLYGGIYYKNTSGKKIYLKPKNKLIKSADGISVTGWKNILDFYEKSNHKITWVHSPTRVLKMVKIGDMLEFTVKTDDSGEMYDNYLDVIVSPDDDGNYPVSIDGKKYLVAGNVDDAKKTFSYVWGAPDVFNRGRNWYVYKFKTRINLTQV
jgi:hypothetical protein